MTSMDDLIRKNKRQSALLIGCMFALFIVLGVTFGLAINGQASGALLGLAVGAIAASIGFATSYYAGSSLVMAASGAKEITKAEHQQLWNVVEEMAIAANLPLPKIYVIEDTAPNAFATGRDPEHAAVAITTGLLEKLDRDELQGVMAHEMAHVQNFDIRIMMLMGVLVGSIALFADMFLRGSRAMAFSGAGRGRRSSNNDKGGAAAIQVIAIVLAIVLSILAPIAARLLMLAVSREREFLADATAAKMTHYPDGLARALAKISGDQEVLEVANRATQHMYIINPIKSHEARAAAHSAFATHPPVTERIQRLQSLVGKV